VHGIDLEIPAGQLVGLLGPNGAGKSTTIKMLTGMLEPTSGTAEIAGFGINDGECKADCNRGVDGIPACLKNLYSRPRCSAT